MPREINEAVEVPASRWRASRSSSFARRQPDDRLSLDLTRDALPVLVQIGEAT